MSRGFCELGSNNWSRYCLLTVHCKYFYGKMQKVKSSMDRRKSYIASILAGWQNTVYSVQCTVYSVHSKVWPDQYSGQWRLGFREYARHFITCLQFFINWNRRIGIFTLKMWCENLKIINMSILSECKVQFIGIL